MKRRLWIAATVVCLAICLTAAGWAAAEGEGGRTGTVILTETAEETETFLLDVDTDRAATEFVDRIMNPDPNALVSKSIGTSLTGADLNMYTRLRRDISAVANGAEGCTGSTIFTYSLGEIYPQTSFTAAELGVDDIVVNYAISSEATQAAKAKFSKMMNFSTVLNYLQLDCSYELYWYDKTQETGGSNSVNSYSYTVNSDWTELVVSGSVKVSMKVSRDYAFRTDNGDGSYSLNLYQVDIARYGQAVARALQNAQGIVDAHENESNYDRLLGYKNAICQMTDYNFDAVDDSQNTPYGNPWQLVWVFDDSTATKVVCGGYSKAFKYLSDLSANTETEVILAEGTMSGGTGAGRHMWNIVRMEDGCNYMADITNCDAGSSGYPDLLFLKAPAEGSASEGYTFNTAASTLTYTYDGNNYGDDWLTLAPYGYLDRPTPEGLYVENVLNRTEFETGEEFTFTAQYTAADTEGITLTARIYNEEEEELTEYTQGSLINEGTFSYQIWNEGEYTLAISAERDGADGEPEVLATETVAFSVAVTQEDCDFDAHIPKFWQFPLTAMNVPYCLTLDYGEGGTVPDKVDITLYDGETGEVLQSMTGVSPDTAVYVPNENTPVEVGDVYHVEVTNYKQGYRVTPYNRYNCRVVIGMLATPEMTVQGVTQPEEWTVTAGQPLTVTIGEVENADYYELGVYGPEQNTYFNIEQAGDRQLAQYGLESGTYALRLTAKAYADYGDSPEAEYTLTVIPNDLEPDPEKTLYLPEDLERIEENAFEGIDAEAVIIPDGCTEVGAGAFRGCQGLQYVSMKQGTVIGDGAFDGCTILKWVIRQADTPEE